MFEVLEDEPRADGKRDVTIRLDDSETLEKIIGAPSEDVLKERGQSLEEWAREILTKNEGKAMAAELKLQQQNLYQQMLEACKTATERKSLEATWARLNDG